MNKNDLNKGYLSVKGFSDFTGISPAAIRNYDRTGVFLAAKRGTGQKNQYRYYSPIQITAIKMIRVLTEIGVPLKTIRELAKDRSPEKLLKLLRKHKEMVAGEIRFLQQAYSIISTFMELLYEGMSVTETEIRVAEMPEKRIILGGRNNFDGGDGFYGEFARFCREPHDPKLNTSYPIGGYFESMDVFMDEPSRPTRFFSLDPNGHERKESGLYLTGYTRGYYGQTNGLPEKMAAYAKKNGLVFTGPVYNIYPFDELSIMDPEQYLLQVCASVRETRRTPDRRPRHKFIY